jgi:hypothetical protein
MKCRSLAFGRVSGTIRTSALDVHGACGALGRAKARPYNAPYKVLGAGLPSEPSVQKRAFNKRR